MLKLRFGTTGGMNPIHGLASLKDKAPGLRQSYNYLRSMRF